MIVNVAADQADAVSALLTKAGEQPVRLGQTAKASGEPRVVYSGKLGLQ